MLITVADLADAVSQEINLEDPRANQLVLAADAAVKHYCRQVIESVAALGGSGGTTPGFGDTVSLDGGTKVLVLPEFPVTAVGSVVEDSVALTEGAENDYVWDRSGLLVRMGADWSTGYRNVEVSYDHGWAMVDIADVRQVAIDAAARAWQEQTAGESTDYPVRTNIALTAEERTALDRVARNRTAR